MNAPLPQGTLLAGRWRVESVLGSGGQATTYAGRDQRTGQAVAIKHLRLGAVDGWKAVELFEREGRALAQLDHPAIPRYLAAFHLDEGGAEPDLGGFYLVQELLEGVALSELLAQGMRATEADVRRLLGDVLEVLAYLHGLHPPVVHRDIKPSNLIRRGAGPRAGSYALIDFGAVQAAAPAGDGLGSTIVGTAGYMAPEQLMGRAGPASDLYALGATAIHVVTGRHPSELPMARMRLQWHDLAPDLDPTLRRVLDRLTEPTPEARYGSAKSALRALRGAEAPAPPAGRPRPTPQVARPRVSRWSWVGGISILLAALVLALPTEVPPQAWDDAAEAVPAEAVPAEAPPEPPRVALDVTLEAPEGLSLQVFEANARIRTFLTLTGTVRNDTGHPLASIQGRARAYDAQGKLVGAADVKAWPSYRPALLPGESAPLSVSPCSIEAPPERVEIELTAEASQASFPPDVSRNPLVPLAWDTARPPGAELEVHERAWREVDTWRPADAAATWGWALDVTNTGPHPLTFLQLEIRGYDPEGRQLPSSGTLGMHRTYVVGSDPLPPGATTAVWLKLRAPRPIHERRLYVVGARVPR